MLGMSLGLLFLVVGGQAMSGWTVHRSDIPVRMSGP
jgi:hypothetical protein